MTSDLRVLALTQGANLPSTRFRLEQYLPSLLKAGLAVAHLPARFSAYPPQVFIDRLCWLPLSVADAFRRALSERGEYDVCFLQRELVSTLVTAEPAISNPFVFDVDDAIFLHRRGKWVDSVARRATLIICGNQFLAEHYARLGRVEILPTAVDTKRFYPSKALKSKPIIGWSGSSSGLKYLYAIEGALRKVLEVHRDAEVHIVSDRQPTFHTLPLDRVRYIPWSADVEVSAVQSFSVGLMPLFDEPWARGKCSFKMLTYMAAGVPVVVSPVGMNSEVLGLGYCGFGPRSDSEWVDAIDHILNDEAAAHRTGAIGRTIVEEHFSVEHLGARLAGLLRSAQHG